MRAAALKKEIESSLGKVSDCAGFEANCLLQHFCSLTLSDIYLDKEIDDVKTDALKEAVKKRCENYPLQYILGNWEFMGYTFCVNENVLIPRPETELLCECLSDKVSAESVVYDLCSGSGCVAISIHKNTGAKVYAFEKYDGAFSILEKNINHNEAFGVEALQCDITQKPTFELEKADFLFSNPPYIKTSEIASLQAEVQTEPHTALDGGKDGLDFYRAIHSNFIPFLKPGGFAAFEIGEGQLEAVKEIFSTLFFERSIKDYNGIERIVVFKNKAQKGN